MANNSAKQFAVNIPAIAIQQHCRDELLAIRGVDFTFEQVRAKAFELDRQSQTAFEQSRLPKRLDFKTVDEFLIEARRSVADLSST